MRRNRERSGISLEQISAATCIRQDLLEALERADLSNWPRGLYSRAWIRAYAEVIGLDPAASVDEFCRVFPHGDRRVDDTMVELAAIVDVRPRSHAHRASHSLRRRASDRALPPPVVSWPDRLARALHIVGNIRRMRDLPVRLAESWRTIRPSRRAW